MDKSYEEIKRYITEVKSSIKAGKYRIALHEKRQANLDLFKTYIIDEASSKKILMSLTADDFCEALQNEHEGFEAEELYVFAKEVTLLQRFGTKEEKVALYIKFNKLENQFVIVISFHKQVHPLLYAFREP